MSNLEINDLSEQVRNDYVLFAQSSNLRAIPDVRDGLKPVHRKSLFGASTIAPSSSSKYVKSAKLVGAIIGELHPHGDLAVYETIVRMAQPFNNNCPYFDTQGSFGGIDGSPQAAQRYTELKLNSFMEWVCLSMLRYNCVETTKNYSGEIDIPTVLPTKLPLHLLNGVPYGSIGNGYTTCCPTHNILEVIEASNIALYSYIFNNAPTDLTSLLPLMPGPDFPTGGYVGNSDDIVKLYKTGKGSIKIRAKTEIEEGRNNSCRIIVTELPYGTTIESVVSVIKEKITPQTKEKSKEKIPPIIEGVKNVFDESGGSKKNSLDVSIVIELEKGANPNITLEKLYKHTNLEISLNCIFNFINSKNQVQQYTLPEILYEWAKHRVKFEETAVRNIISNKADDLHIVSGIMLLLDYPNLPELIDEIRGCSSNSEVTDLLIARLECTYKQALRISEMKLTQLSNLNYTKFAEKVNSLKEEIAALEKSISTKNDLYNLCYIDCNESIFKKLNTERKSVLMDFGSNVDPKSLVKDEYYIITLSKDSIIKRMSTDAIQTQNRSGKGNKKSIGIRKEDALISVINCHAHDSMLAITNTGFVIRFEVYSIPDKPQGISSLACGITNSPDENVVCLIPFVENEESDIIIALKNGNIKRIALKDFLGKRNKRISCFSNNITIAESIIGAIKITQSDMDRKVVMLTKNSLATRYPISDIKRTSITSRAQSIFKLRSDDELIKLKLIDTDDVVIVYEDSTVKIVSTKNISLKLPCYMYENKDGMINSVVAIEPFYIDNNYSDELLLISNSANSVRISINDLYTIRKTGLKAMNLGDGEIITYASILPSNK